MTDGKKRIGGEPVFDTDRAWDRFEKLAAREAVQSYWTQADEDLRSEETRIKPRMNENEDSYVKEGAVEMNQMEEFKSTQGSSLAGTAGTDSSTKTYMADSTWRTESPVRRRLQRLIAGAAAAAMVVGLFATPLGDKALAAMQQTLRIQHMVGVGISADDMTSIAEVLEHGSPEGDKSFNLAQYGTLTQSGGGKAATVTWEEAEQRMGTPLHKLENPTSIQYQPATTLTFNLKVEAVNRLLTRLGSRTTLPAEADGKTIRLHIPDGISSEGALSGKQVRLLQFGKPELTVESGIDVATVREAVLGLPVLPESLRTKLAAIGDWNSTLPVPAREGVTTTIQFNGHDAVMTMGQSDRFILWLDGDRLSLLSGESKDFPTEAAFLKAAEELVQP